MLSSKFLLKNEEKNIDGRWGGGGGWRGRGVGKRRGLGPRNDVLTTCKAVQNPYWPAVFLNGKPLLFRAKKKGQSRRNPSRSCLQLNIRGFSKFCTS